MTQITPTLSLIEAIWILMAFIPAMRSARLTWLWNEDRKYAKKHKQEAREIASTLLLTVGIGVSAVLIFNGLAGVISGTVPPSGGSISSAASAIAVLLILGQVAIVVMLEGVGRFYNRLLRLGTLRVKGKKKDLGQ